MAPIEPHWVCETCQRPYAAQPIACECGARAFVAVELDVGGLGVGASVKAPTLAERHAQALDALKRISNGEVPRTHLHSEGARTYGCDDEPCDKPRRR